MTSKTSPAPRSKNPDRRHRTSMHYPKAGGARLAHLEWALDVPTTPREKLVLVALASRPGSTAEHLAHRTGMTVTATKEAVEDLMSDGWIYHCFDGGYLVDIAAEELRDFPMPQSALAAELAQSLSHA